MLYVNGELLSTGDYSDEYKYKEIVADYHKTIKYVLDYYGNHILVQTKIRPRSDAKTGVPRFPGPRGLLLVSNMKRENESGGISQEELRYSPSILNLDDKGNLKHESPNMLIHRGEKSIDVKRDQDLVYYIMKCGKVGITPAEGKKFCIYDAKTINKEGASKRRAEGRVIHLIYDAIPEHEVRILAKSWGLNGVDTMGIEAVREMLFEKVEAGEALKAKQGLKSRGFKEFAASGVVKEVDRLTALCKDAEEKKSLIFNREDRTWLIDYKDKGKPYTLKELSGDEFGDPLGALVSHIMSDESALRKIENVMGKKFTPIPPMPDDVAVPRMDAPRYTIEQINAEKRVPTLKKMLKELQPDIKLPTTLKGDDVRRMLLQAVLTEGVQG